MCVEQRRGYQHSPIFELLVTYERGGERQRMQTCVWRAQFIVTLSACLIFEMSSRFLQIEYCQLMRHDLLSQQKGKHLQEKVEEGLTVQFSTVTLARVQIYGKSQTLRCTIDLTWFSWKQNQSWSMLLPPPTAFLVYWKRGSKYLAFYVFFTCKIQNLQPSAFVAKTENVKRYCHGNIFCVLYNIWWITSSFCTQKIVLKVRSLLEKHSV